MEVDAARRDGAGSGRAGGSSRSPARRLPEDSRSALLSAAARLVAQDGADAVTREGVCATAGLPPSIFDAVFAGRVDCLVAVFDATVDRAHERARVACSSAESWLDGIRCALYELLSFLEENAGMARFMVVESLSGEPAILARRQRLLAELAATLDFGRPPAPPDATPAPFGGNAVVGAVVAIVHARLQETCVPQLTDLGGPLMGVLVLPYLGVDAARDELSRPAPNVPLGVEGGESADQRAATAVGQRLTPKALAVLRAIAARPGMNNRQVAETVGISGSAQASRTLARLARLGLIMSGTARTRSGNAWQLTGTGRWLSAEIGSTSGD